MNFTGIWDVVSRAGGTWNDGMNGDDMSWYNWRWGVR